MRLLLPHQYITHLLMGIACLLLTGIILTENPICQRDYSLAVTMLLVVLHVLWAPCIPRCFDHQLEAQVPCIRRYVFVDRVLHEDTDSDSD